MVFDQMASPNPHNRRLAMRFMMVLLCCPVAAAFWGCAGLMERPAPMDSPAQTPVETILDTHTGQEISFEDLVERLSSVRIVYVGEQHTNARHHEVQLKIIQALAPKQPRLVIGMEMFDHTYQPKLDLWTRGQFDWAVFLRQVHWYANWKYPADLYKGILEYIQTRKLPLVGLNIPFCLPPKIAGGGLASLSPSERAQLPRVIDTTQPAHRQYLKEIYDQHHFPGQGDFESFYEAQCAWEDGMAQAIADQGQVDIMVVLAGNGHIVRKFGIPDRAYKRLPLPFRTVYLTTHGMDASPEHGDFIWTTDSKTLEPDGMHP